MELKKKFSTKKEKVYTLLRNDIINGTLKPGERLIIAQIAEKYEMSLIPVREAIQGLAADGYLIFNPHSGAIVSKLSRKDIREIFQIRINLECLATQLAVEHLSNAHIEKLNSIIERSKEVLEQKAFKEYGAYNREFHELIYKHANNERLFNIISELWDNSRRYPNLFDTVEDLEISIEEHQEIVAALKERDEKLVVDLIKKHKHRAYEKLLNLVQD